MAAEVCGSLRRSVLGTSANVAEVCGGLRRSQRKPLFLLAEVCGSLRKSACGGCCGGICGGCGSRAGNPQKSLRKSAEVLRKYIALPTGRRSLGRLHPVRIGLEAA